MDTSQKNQQENHPGSGQISAPGEKNTVMGILSYIGPLVIVPYLVAKDDPFVKFHIKQGLVLFVIEVAILVIGTMFWLILPLLHLINLGILILAIIGVVNVVKGVEKELPIVGKYSKYATF